MAADLERNDASRRRFFQDAAHEMKTPLAVIEATAAAVMDGVYEHDDRHLATIRSQARLLGRVVDDLRTISLAEAGALPLRLEPVPLADVLPSIGAAFAARAEAAGVTLSTELVEGMPLVVTADRERLGQAIAALVDNAIRFALRGPREPARRSSPRSSALPGSRCPTTARAYPTATWRTSSTGSTRRHQPGPRFGHLGARLAITRAIVEAHGEHGRREPGRGRRAVLDRALAQGDPAD